MCNCLSQTECKCLNGKICPATQSKISLIILSIRPSAFFVAQLEIIHVVLNKF